MAIRSARISEHRVGLLSSYAGFNQSRTHTLPIWDVIDSLKGDKKPQVFDDIEVVGTLGAKKKGFSPLTLVESCLHFSSKRDGIPVPIYNGHVCFSKVFSKDDSKVLILQGEYPECCSDLANSGTDPDFLLRLLGKLQFHDAHLSLRIKRAGHEHRAFWYGQMQNDHIDTLLNVSDEIDAWRYACPHEDTQSEVPQKMVIPIEYDSFYAARELGKTGEIFEDLIEKDVVDPAKYVATKRLLGYRDGLMYFKYKCLKEDGGEGGGASGEKLLIEIQKVSLILEYQPDGHYYLTNEAHVRKKYSTESLEPFIETA